MTKKELQNVWKERKKLYAESDKLVVEGNALTFKDGKVIVFSGSDERWNERKKLIEKGIELEDKGQLLFYNAVREVYGESVTIKWSTGYKCTLSNGEIFG